MLRSLGKIVLVVFLLLTCFAFTAPFIFKGKILQLAKNGVNCNLNAKTDFSDVDISFFRQFPRVSVGLENIYVKGINEFSGDTLLSAEKLDVAVDLFSVIRGKSLRVYSITLDHPRIHAIINKDGKANWDIAKQDTAQTPQTESKPFQVELKQYTIRNAYIYYHDEPGNMSGEIFNLTHTGKGDFTSDLFTLSTSTKAVAVNFNYGGVSYLSNTATTVDADIKIDNKTQKYSFDKINILLNDLKLASNGFFQLADDTTYKMDINFQAPETEFRQILSLVPSIFKKDFDKIKTNGKAVLNGFVRGTYSPVQMPGYNLNLEISDANFQYPDLPRAVKNINVLATISNPDGITDNLVIDIPKGHFEMDKDPFDFRLIFKKPETDMYIDVVAKGKLDLAELGQFVKLEQGTNLSGLLNADILAKGNLAVIQKKQAGEFSASGILDITNLNYASKDIPQPIRNGNLTIRIENQDGIADHTVVNIPKGHIEIGEDPVDFNLLIKNPVSDLFFDGSAKGKFNLANAAQFNALPAGSTLTGLLNADIAFRGKQSAIEKKYYEAIYLAGEMDLSDLNYVSTEFPEGVRINKALFTFNLKNVTINSFYGNHAKTDFSATGSLDNLIGYALNKQALEGKINLNAGFVDLNKLMGTGASSTPETAAASKPFAVPGNINFVLNTKAEKVLYDKVEYNNVNGTLQVKDQTVFLKNVRTEALDGTIAMDGYYSTKVDKNKPDILLNYSVKGLDIQKTFLAFNTVEKLMPIGKFLSGKLSSQMKVDGKLGEDMMPVVQSLTGNGNLLLLEGLLKKFGPLEKLADLLNIEALKEISIKDVKNHIEFINGKVMVKPFKLKANEIDMEIGGMHGFDQSLDYIINLKVPRKLIGEKGNALVNDLAIQASNKGIPLKLNDIVNLNIKMNGTIASPVFKTDLKEMAGDMATELKQQAVNMAKEKADSTKLALKDTMNNVKKQLVSDVKENLTKQFLQPKDSTDSGKGKLVDDIKNNSGETIKSTLSNINPFKKKKQAKDSTKQ